MSGRLGVEREALLVGMVGVRHGTPKKESLGVFEVLLRQGRGNTAKGWGEPRKRLASSMAEIEGSSHRDNASISF